MNSTIKKNHVNSENEQQTHTVHHDNKMKTNSISSLCLLFVLYYRLLVLSFVLPSNSNHGTSAKFSATASNFVEAFLMSQQPSGVSFKTLQDMIEKQKLRENFVVVVTGATGGIGRTICQTVLSLNGLIVAVDFNKKALMELKAINPERIRTVESNCKFGKR